MIGPLAFPAFPALEAFFGLGDRDRRVICGVLESRGEPRALPLRVATGASYPVVGGVCGWIVRSNVCQHHVSMSCHLKQRPDHEPAAWNSKYSSARCDTSKGRHTDPNQSQTYSPLKSSSSADEEMLTVSGSLKVGPAGLIDLAAACRCKPATCCCTAPRPKSPSLEIGGDGGCSPTTGAVILAYV